MQIDRNLNLVSAGLADVMQALDEDAIDQDNLRGKELKGVFQALDRGIALDIAKRLDDERAEGRVRSLLHGVPIIIKDHFGTGPDLGFNTTAGIKAFEHVQCPADAPFIHRLRQQGLIVLGKGNMVILHNLFCKDLSAVGAWNQNLGVPRGVYDPLKTGGSSSGPAIALSAGWCAGAIGAKTAGSVVNPASLAALYGMEPSVGLIKDAREGSIGLSERWDGVGPMGKSVLDVAMMLDVMVERKVDPPSYVDELIRLRKEGCSLRLGVHYPDRLERGKIAEGAARIKAFDEAVERLGCDPSIELVYLAGATEAVYVAPSPYYDAFQTELQTHAYESLNTFMANVKGSAVENVKELLQWQVDHPEVSSIPGVKDTYWHIQRIAERKGNKTDPEYLVAVDLVEETRGEILAFMADNKLDALVGDLGLALMASYSNSTYANVPVGMYDNSLEPQALCFMGRPFEEAQMLRIMSIAEDTFGPRPLPPSL